MADLIPYTTEQILDLFKAAYYEQTGETLRIGSEEFAFSTVASYVLRVFEQAMKRGADAVSINTATGEALDNIAASFGITRPGATASRMAIALESISGSTVVLDVGQIVATTAQNVDFKNIAPVSLPGDGTTVSLFLYCDELGSQYNGMSIDEIELPDTVQLIASSASKGAIDSMEEYTPENDAAFRAYVLEGIKALSVGTASYYEYEAKKGYDGILADVYCLRDGDTGFEAGKVKIKTLFVSSIATTAYKMMINSIIRDYLSSDAVKCVTDYVEVAEGEAEYLNIIGIVIYYETRFQALNSDGISLAQAHFERVFAEYREKLLTHFNMPYTESALEAMLCKPDENGVYATTFKSNASYHKPGVGKKFIISAQWDNATVNWI